MELDPLGLAIQHGSIAPLLRLSIAAIVQLDQKDGCYAGPACHTFPSGFTTLSFFENGIYTGDIEYHGIGGFYGSAVPVDGDFVEAAALAPPEDAWTANPTFNRLEHFTLSRAFMLP